MPTKRGRASAKKTVRLTAAAAGRGAIVTGARGAAVAGGTTAANVAMSGSPSGALVTMLFGFVGVGIGLAFDAALGFRKAQASRFVARLTSVLEERGATIDEVKGIFESRAADPAVHEAVFESVRRLLDACAPDVAEPLGALLATYLADNRAPDRFFRGVARTLADVSSESYADLRRIIGAAVAQIDEHGLDEISLTWGMAVASQEKVLKLVRSETEGVDLHDLHEPDQIVHLLRQHRLASVRTDGAVWSSPEHNWTEQLVMSADDVRAVWRLVR
jgi:hypothetical protein